MAVNTKTENLLKVTAILATLAIGGLTIYYQCWIKSLSLTMYPFDKMTNEQPSYFNKNTELLVYFKGDTSALSMKDGHAEYYFSTLQKGEYIEVNIRNCEDCITLNNRIKLREGKVNINVTSNLIFDDSRDLQGDKKKGTINPPKAILVNEPSPPYNAVSILITASQNDVQETLEFDLHPTPHVKCTSSVPLEYLKIQPDRKSTEIIEVDTDIDQDPETLSYIYSYGKLNYKTAGYKFINIFYKVPGDKNEHKRSKRIHLNRKF